MSEFTYGGEQEPGEILALASSIVQRNAREFHWEQSILAETVPIPPRGPAEVAHSVQIGATIVMLGFLENPNMAVDPVDTSRTIVDNRSIVTMLRNSDEEPTEENAELVRAMLDGQMKIIGEHFAVNQDGRQRMKAIVDTAKIVADRHAVGICEVFDSDNLYAECIRTLHTPQTYTEEAISTIEKMNQEFVIASAENIINAMLQAEMARGEITADVYHAEKAKLMQELLEDEGILADLSADLSAIRDASRNVITRGIERFWGN